MRILFLGDIVGRPAREYLQEIIPQVKKDQAIDCVIANAENAAGGSSVTMQIAQGLFEAGLDILTSGDHIFKKKEVKDVLDTFPVLRPLNYGKFAWGSGYVIKEINGIKIAVVNLIGRVFMQPVDCPFKAMQEILPALKAQTNIIIVDIHAEATSEKLAMGYFLATQVSAVLGTHTHIVTADERIIENHTAYISDVGMTGGYDSILGREKHQIIERFLTNMPLRFHIAQNDIRMQGVIVDINPQTGAATAINRAEYRKENI